MVIFDEFHERNLLSDVALALAKRLQQTRRPDLKIVVMSATLEAEPVAKYLGGCPVLVSEGKAFPVEIRHLDLPDERPVSEQAGDAVARIVEAGDPRRHSGFHARHVGNQRHAGRLPRRPAARSRWP